MDCVPDDTTVNITDAEENTSVNITEAEENISGDITEEDTDNDQWLILARKGERPTDQEFDFNCTLPLTLEQRIAMVKGRFTLVWTLAVFCR